MFTSRFQITKGIGLIYVYIYIYIYIYIYTAAFWLTAPVLVNVPKGLQQRTQCCELFKREGHGQICEVCNCSRRWALYADVWKKGTQRQAMKSGYSPRVPALPDPRLQKPVQEAPCKPQK